MSERVSLDALYSHKASRFICWPEPSTDLIAERMEELRLLGVKAIFLTGRHTIEGIPVLGKGHTGLVLEAETRDGNLALKARRMDADRPSMEEEARLLKLANHVGVGPEIIKWSRNFLLMELISGVYLRDWIRELRAKETKDLKKVLRAVVDQARRLDEAGVDHGELVRLRRHIMLRRGKPVFIDFESASTLRRPANVTTVIQSFFLNSKISSIIDGQMGLPDRIKLLDKLHAYKREMNLECYTSLLEAAQLI